MALQLSQVHFGGEELGFVDSMLCFAATGEVRRSYAFESSHRAGVTTKGGTRDSRRHALSR